VTVGRRSFLGLFAASPLAAKVAADKALADATGMIANGAAGMGNSSPPFGNPAGASEVAPDIRRSRIADFFKRSGVPDWELDRIKRDSRFVYGLDPDIAALRSFSMNVKIGMQRERNVQRELERMKGQNVYEQMRDDFRKKHGFWFWW
jgi:hypothetical protein